MSKPAKPTFESQLETLEKIVTQLEKGDLTLDESLAQFEQGVKLTKDCQHMLTEAEQKVLILNEDNDQLEEFE